MRSFHARQGRMGPQLRAAWQDGSSGMLMPAGPWPDLPPGTLLEIGSGMGDGIVAAAPRFALAIGVDVHVRGLAATMRQAADRGLANIRLVQGDAVEVLQQQVPAGALAEIHVWFPDPWPKARHRKRRLIRPAVADLLAGVLRPGGMLRLATDVADYGDEMALVLGSHAGFVPQGDRGRVPRPGWRPVTRYEAAGLRQGRAPVELAYRRA